MTTRDVTILDLDAAAELSLTDNIMVAQGDKFLKRTPLENVARLKSFLQTGTGAVPRSVPDKALERITPEDFNCVGDDDADDTANFQKAIDAVAAMGGGALYPTKQYNVDNLILKEGVVLVGDYVNAAPVDGANPYNLRSRLRCRGTGGLLFEGHRAAAIGLVLIKDGLTIPTNDAECAVLLTQFSGRAIFASHFAPVLRDLLILGFEYAATCDLTQQGAPFMATNVHSDTLKGYDYGGNLASPRLENCHNYPYLTMTVQGVSNASLNRPGTGFLSRATNDHSTLNRCSTFGYRYGLELLDASGHRITNCSFDGTGDGLAGIYAHGSTQETTVIGCLMVNHVAAVRVELGPSNPPGSDVVTLIGNTLIAANAGGTAVDVISGRVFAAPNQVHFCTNGFRLGASAGACVIQEQDWNTVTNKFVISNTGNLIHGFDATSGMIVQTGLGTFAKRTLTAPAAGLTITNNTGVAGNPTFALANDLAGLEALSGTGFAVRTATDTWAQRSLTAPAAGLTITNNTGVSGNPTFALANDLAALEGLGGTGFAVRTAADTWAQRSLAAPAAGLTISNNDAVSGNPTFALANDLAALEAYSSTGAWPYRSATDTWTSVALSSNLSFSGGTLDLSANVAIATSLRIGAAAIDAVLNPSLQTSGQFLITNAGPSFALKNTSAATDYKFWDFFASTTDLAARAVKDDYSGATAWLQVTRSGAGIATVWFPSGQMKFGGSNFAANGSVATVLGSLGPTGAHTTVQEWMAIQNASGVVRYFAGF